MNELLKSLNGEQIPELIAQLPQDDPAFERAIEVVRFAPDDCLISPDTADRYLYILVSGRVRLVVFNKEGRSYVTSYLDPGSVFGEDALIDFGEKPRSHVHALEPCTVWRLPTEQAHRFADKHPVLALGMLLTLGNRLAQVENRLEEVAYKRLPERLAGELLRLRRYYNNDQVRVSHQALADTLGTYRETISALLRDFKRDQWVELGYRRITIKDPEAMAQLAGNIHD
ncbi:MAG TPA: Crp/Fnr family transcriptional regulator [Caldilineae bacterium]|nr:Crp/Fnr family transcriptional regulator [Caldilineae bacterium]